MLPTNQPSTMPLPAQPLGLLAWQVRRRKERRRRLRLLVLGSAALAGALQLSPLRPAVLTAWSTTDTTERHLVTVVPATAPAASLGLAPNPAVVTGALPQRAPPDDPASLVLVPTSAARPPSIPADGPPVPTDEAQLSPAASPAAKPRKPVAEPPTAADKAPATTAGRAFNPFDPEAYYKQR
jgi:hypothetical protein